jgi:hypothetical protein
MRFLYSVRFVTVLIAAVGCWASTPSVWIAWFEELLGISGGIYHSRYSCFTGIMELCIYIIAVAAVIVAFVAIPRTRWGPSALSWCFLAMGVCLLTDFDCYSDRRIFGSILVELGCYARQLWFALPSLLFGALLRYSFIRDRLHSSPVTDATDV